MIETVKKPKKDYIIGLKGIACVLIMVGHYIGLYRLAQSFTPSIPVLDRLCNSKYFFLVNEIFWKYLFFVISGYLVAHSRIPDFSAFIKKTVLRVFRFFFPILFSCAVIWVCYLIFGFHNAETVSLFQCDNFQGYYTKALSVFDVLLSPFKTLFSINLDFNPPYWFLVGILVGSVLIYFLQYLLQFIGSKPEVRFFALIGCTLIVYVIHPLLSAMLTGMIVAIYEDQFSSLTKAPFFPLCCIAGAFFLMVIPPKLLYCFVFAMLIIFAPRSKIVSRILSSKPILFLGDISWGVYSFHWPLISSVGAIVMLRLTSGPENLIGSYVLACIVSASITFVLAILYHYTFEKLSSSIYGKIVQFVNKI